MTWIIQFTQNCILPKVQVSQLRKCSASSECAMVPVGTQALELITLSLIPPPAVVWILWKSKQRCAPPEGQVMVSLPADGTCSCWSSHPPVTFSSTQWGCTLLVSLTTFYLHCRDPGNLARFQNRKLKWLFGGKGKIGSKYLHYQAEVSLHLILAVI